MTSTTIDSSIEEQPFSTIVRSATAEEHTAAENTLYVRELLAGNVAREGFERLVVHHLAIYSALEDAAELMVDDPVAGCFVMPELHRRDALVADVSALGVEP
ncbi:MAG TPA: biliverdin-producing heme oxygenase, partial [Microthrixaceae bacterium]|nr:biliverdin-producing heme oxygenase [Microthrixaceae bacterium]